jgi:hypothetical protein
MTVFPLENTSLVALAQALAMLIICGGGFGWQRTGMGQVLAPLMSAIGPKRTSLVAPHMSAFGGKADITLYGNPLLRSLLRVERT